MAIASIGGYDMMGSLNTQNSVLKMMDVSALTSGNLSTTDSANLSSVLGSDYTNYQNMLNGVSTTSLGSTTATNTGAGVGLTSDGKFDFKSYFNTYFPNLSDEEVAALTEQYSKSYDAMFEQMGGAMDMSNLASMAMGSTSTANSADVDSVLKQLRATYVDSSSSASSSTDTRSMRESNVNEYIKNFFPDASEQDAEVLRNNLLHNNTGGASTTSSSSLRESNIREYIKNFFPDVSDQETEALTKRFMGQYYA